MALLAVTLAAFFTGRTVEERALAAKARADMRPSTSPSSAINPGPTSYRQLAALDLLTLPFAEFYEALRSAPGEARKKWASELETMPDGPRRIAAVSAFYKLLVQFDPITASRTIYEIKDKRLQNLALECAVDAAPGFAMPTLADLCLSLEGGPSSKLWDVLGEWMLIDAPAVAQFIDDHPDPDDDRSLPFRDLISNLASLDPKVANEWMEKKDCRRFPNSAVLSLTAGMKTTALRQSRMFWLMAMIPRCATQSAMCFGACITIRKRKRGNLLKTCPTTQHDTRLSRLRFNTRSWVRRKKRENRNQPRARWATG
jgi:hypothetical protein